MSISQKVATAGITLQNNLNARGVDCTFGKNSDSKQRITDMANLINSSNLKGASDKLLHLYMTRPYLMSGESTDLIATLHDGLGNPISGEEVTITGDITDSVIDTIWDSSSWDSITVTSTQISCSNSNMITEFTDLKNYVISFIPTILSSSSSMEIFFGDTISQARNNYLKFTWSSMVIKLSKFVNGVETVIASYNIDSSRMGRWFSENGSISRNGDTYTFFGETVTLSGLSNTLGFKNVRIAKSYVAVTSLYRSITNQNGQLIYRGLTVSALSEYTAVYNSLSSNVTVYYALFTDYGVTGDNNSSNIILYQGVRTIGADGTLIECDTNNRWDIRPNNFGLFSAPFTLEFEIVSTSGRLAIYGYNSSTTSMFTIDTNQILNDGDIVKIVVTSTSATFYLNGVQKIQRTYNSTSTMKIRIFYNVANTYLKYKDFVVY